MNQERGRSGLAGWVLWGALAVSIAAIIIVSAMRKPPEAPVDVAPRAVPVRTIALALRAMPDAVRLPAKVEAGADVTVSAEKPGRVAEAPVEKGDRVEAGQVLLRLDRDLIGAARTRVEIEKREAERALARWSDLKKTGAVADSEMDAIRQRLDLAEAARVETDAHLARCEVKSPIAGSVEDRRFDVGEYAHEGDPAFRIVDVSRVKLILRVAERDIGFVKPGLAVPFRVLTIPGAVFTGRVSFVASVAGREDNAFPVEALVPNGEGRLRAGMIAEATLVRRADAQALAVPLATVIPEKGEHVVYAVEDGRAARRIVRLVGQTESEAIVGSGLREGDRIVIEGHRGLQDGLTVIESGDGASDPAGAGQTSGGQTRP